MGANVLKGVFFSQFWWSSIVPAPQPSLGSKALPHMSGYLRTRRFFPPYLKKSASTRTVLKSYLHVHTSTQKRFWYARLHILGMRRLRAHAPCDNHKPAKSKEFAAIFVWVILVWVLSAFFTVIKAVEMQKSSQKTSKSKGNKTHNNKLSPCIVILFVYVGDLRGGSRGRVQGVRTPPPHPPRWSFFLRIRF